MGKLWGTNTAPVKGMIALFAAVLLAAFVCILPQTAQAKTVTSTPVITKAISVGENAAKVTWRLAKKRARRLNGSKFALKAAAKP